MRLHDRTAARAVEPVSIRFNDRTIEALPGESVAAALAAQGINVLRATRTGAGRGLYCGMGACFDCIVTIDGRAGERACMTKVTAGMVIESAVPPLADAVPIMGTASGDAPIETPCDVLVIGAGPAGLAAAATVAESGLSVIMLDERPAPGGQYYKPLAPSVRPRDGAAIDAQFEAGRRLTERVRRAGVVIESEATVWGAIAADEIGAIVEGQARLYRPRRVVLATGAYERPVPIPGWTLPGVMTTGAVQTLARSYRVSPGERVLIAGNGPLNLQLACELVRGSVKVVGVIESAPRPGFAKAGAALALWRHASDLARDGIGYLATLAQARVPIAWGAEVIACEGTDRFRAARIASKTGERTIEADVLALGYGFIPSTELARALGCAMQFVDRHLGYVTVQTDADGRTSVEQVYAVGDGAAIGGARVAEARGTLAGIAIAESLGRTVSTPTRETARTQLDRATRFQDALWTLFAAPPVDVTRIADTTMVCRCEEVTAGEVRAPLAEGYTTVGAVKRLTRCGMGRCQARYCQATLARLVEHATGVVPDAYAFFAPRPPAKPVPVAALAFEKPEWGGHREVKPPPPMLAGGAVAAVGAPWPEAGLAADVIVIGGGVAGVCTAYYLAREGIDTLLIERDAVNLQASGGNAGSLHVQLLSFDFGPKAQAGGGPAADTLPLGPIAVRLWQAIEAQTRVDLEIKVAGGLMVAETPEQMRFLEAKIALERSRGIDAELLNANDLRRLAPMLDASLAGAEFCALEGKINPLTATYAVARAARAAGARFETRTEVQSIERVGHLWHVRTTRGVARARRVVNAAGPWSPRVAQMAGIDRLPVQGAPLQMIVTEPTTPALTQLIAHADRHLTLKQTAAGGFVIGGGWTAGVHPESGFSRVLRSSIEGNLWVARRVLPALDRLRMIRAWAAMNVNIDGAPIVGEAPGRTGFYNCVTSNGYTLGPVVGRITADLIVRGRSDLIGAGEFERFTLARFG